MTVERMIEIVFEETTIELYRSEWEELERAFEKILKVIESEKIKEDVEKILEAIESERTKNKKGC